MDPSVGALLNTVYNMPGLNEYFGSERDLRFDVHVGAPFNRKVLCGLGVFPSEAPVIPVVSENFPNPRRITRDDPLDDHASVWLLNATSPQAVQLLVKLSNSNNFNGDLAAELADMVARSVAADLPW